MMKYLLCTCPPKKKYMIAIVVAMVAIAMVLMLRPIGLNMLAAYREEQAFLNMIRLCGAELQSVNVTGWSRVAGPEEIDLEALVNRTAGLLKLEQSGQTMEKWENPYARGVKVLGIMPGGDTVVVLAQTMELLQGQRVTHVMISLEAELGKTGYYKEKIKEALPNRSTEEHIALTYTGKINCSLNSEELTAKAEEVMAGAGATIQERTFKDNMISLTGHSPSLSGDLNYNGKEVNLNVAFRSNAEQQATYVYVASPVIYTEY